ncbi:uncharacterized protein [Phyllobates terribilis]|uniref:uncharacterized protein n=1 Tax=Phyllobates terribilis TaxID=111132 RepID=UPI003CCB2C27
MLRLKREPGLKQLTAPVREMIACRALSFISDCKYCIYSSSPSKVQVLVKNLVSSEIIAALVPEENCLETAGIGWLEYRPSRLCKGYLTKKESDGVLRQMTWPPPSPDLNPIEMVWGELDCRVKAKGPTSAKHLWELLQDCWKTISGDYLLKLIKRIPRVCKAVIKAKVLPFCMMRKRILTEAELEELVNTSDSDADVLLETVSKEENHISDGETNAEKSDSEVESDEETQTTSQCKKSIRKKKM